MPRIWSGCAAAVVVAVAVGCGPQPSVAAPTALSTQTELDVLLDEAVVRGGDGLTVRALPAGTLREGSPTVSMILLQSDRRRSMAGLVRFAGKARRSDGGADLGATGMCGRGWSATGHRLHADPCSALEAVTQIPAGRAFALRVLLYPATGSGPVTTGTYDLTVPLDERGTVRLDLRYRVVESGQATLPAWPAETLPLAITFEPSPANQWWRLRVRIEDGYGRVIDERDLAGYRSEHPDLEREGVFTIDVPSALPFHPVLLERLGGTWVPCNRGTDIVTEERTSPTTLLTSGCFRQ